MEKKKKKTTTEKHWVLKRKTELKREITKEFFTANDSQIETLGNEG